MGDWIHHRDGSPGGSVRARILHMGALLFTSTIPPVEVSERANNDRLMYAVRRDVHLLLVKASLFSAVYHQSQQHTNTRKSVLGTTTSARTYKSSTDSTSRQLTTSLTLSP